MEQGNEGSGKMGHANAMYKNRLATVLKLAEVLVDELDAHKSRQAESPRNWGWAGDLGHIEDQLDEAIRVLKSSHKD